MMRFPINSMLASRVAFTSTKTATSAVAAAFSDRLSGLRMMSAAPSVKVRVKRDACTVEVMQMESFFFSQSLDPLKIYMLVYCETCN